MVCISAGFFLVVTDREKDKNQPDNCHIFDIIDAYLSMLYHNANMEICWALDKPKGPMFMGRFSFGKHTILVLTIIM